MNDYRDLLACGASNEEAIEQLLIFNQPQGLNHGYEPRNQDHHDRQAEAHSADVR